MELVLKLLFSKIPIFTKTKLLIKLHHVSSSQVLVIKLNTDTGQGNMILHLQMELALQQACSILDLATEYFF